MIQFKDFVPNMISPPQLFKAGQYESFEEALAAANQWIADNKGKWIELNTARFTVDNTGAKRYRMDFAGGSAEGKPAC